MTTTTPSTPASPPAIEIRYVDTRAGRNIVDIAIEHPDGQRYVVGHLPIEGWFCHCTRGKKCPRIAAVQALVPRIPLEAP
jgi:hypothetical protein